MRKFAIVGAGPGTFRSRAVAAAGQVRARRFCVVGDYLFDATLNGVLRSATNVAELIAASVASDALLPPDDRG